MKPDLTRWNRAGLKRFRYVDGNAATYLEALRRELAARPTLSGWDKELLGIEGDALNNYLSLNDKRGSIALEIVRSFARATHVLTEHLDAYANEGFLGTATQWENVRRLIYGLSYHPRPPSSAVTQLVLHAKPDKAGLVARGLQIKHTPEGKSPVVFETLEAIQVDPAFNALRLKNWNRSQDEIDTDELRLDGVVEGLKSGEPIVVENADGDLFPRLLLGVSVEDECTVLGLNAPVSGRLSDLIIHLKPVEKLEISSPLRRQISEKGKTSSLLLEEEPTALKRRLSKTKNEYVFIGEGKTGFYRRVVEDNKEDNKKVLFEPAITEKELLARLSESASDYALTEADCYVGLPEIMDVEIIKSSPTLSVKGDVTWLKEAYVFLFQGEPQKGKEYKVSNAKKQEIPKVDRQEWEPVEYETILTLSDTVTGSGLGQLFIPPEQWKWKMDSFVGLSDKALKVNTIKRMARGEVCVVGSGSTLVAARVKNITEEETGSGLQIESWQPGGIANQSEKFLRSQTRVFGKFKEQARLQGWNVNTTPISGNKLMLDDEEAAGKLKAGRVLVIEHEPPDATGSFLTSVLLTGEAKGGLTLKDELPEKYITGRTVVRANVVSAGHGETQPEKILGSGNATLSNQEFLFPVSNVSFVSDTKQDSGVRADIRITVDDETWTQVPRFDFSQATDIHYVVRLTEEGHLQIIFGDGIHGRRLPTGENNVRIAWRMGSGEAGRLAAGLLKKPAHPHPRVEAIAQPFNCEGGEDMEPVTSLRRNAPASLLTMERAVSASDFAQLAESHPNVWRARAELESLGREQIVCVTIVPAGGGDTLSEESANAIRGYLLERAIPGIRVRLKLCTFHMLKLNVTLYIYKERFDVKAVEEEVHKALLERFTLRNRAIGAPVYLSDIYQCVTAIRGVEYSVCQFKGEKDNKQTLSGGEHEVFYMDESEEQCIYITVEDPQK